MKVRYLLPFLALLGILSSCSQPRPGIQLPPKAAVNVYFSPRGGGEEAVIRLIRGAHASIDAAVYSFTSREIANALISAANHGVSVRLILDWSQSDNRYSKYRFFLNRGIHPRLLSGVGRGIMHDKFAVFDRNAVATGSFNWTASAERYNRENLLVVTGDPEIAETYEREFERLYAESR